MELQELTKIVEELWFSYKLDQILGYIQLPLAIFEIIVMYKLNQVLKIYIYENKDYLN